MRKYIIYSTLFSVFSEAFLINYIIDLKLFYLIVFLNLLLISFYFPIKFSKNMLLILSLIFGFGIITIVLGTNSFSRLISQFLGIFIISYYYYSFFENGGMSVDYYFKLYSQFAYYLSVIGLFVFFSNLLFYMEIIPVKSVMLEPAHYCTVVLPACYYWFKNRSKERGLLKFFIIVLSIILSFSSLGILGILLGVFLVPRKINILKLILPTVAGVAAFILLLNFVPSFSMRVKDTVDSFINRDLSNANLSSYALISNLFVATESFKHNPIIGGGLGSHVISHQRIISTVEGTDNFGDMIDLNAQDANSLFIRVVSELGLFGVFLVVGFIYKFYTVADEDYKIVSRSILIYFFCKLLREGHYFSPEMYFFIFAYWYNNKNFIAHSSRINLA